MAALRTSLATPVCRRSLLDAEPDFAAGIAAEDQRLATAALRLPAVVLEVGLWVGPDAHPAIGLVVLEGILTRAVELQGRTGLELFGPGDVILRGEDATWDVLEEATLVVLDDRFVLAARRWPSLWQVVTGRVSQRGDRLAAHLAALQQSRVEARIETVLWQLADRWGHVTTDGVVVRVPLTHAMLGRLVAAKRPTISLALTSLAEPGTVVSRPDGWLLTGAAPDGY